jgi:hypothetical protein
VKRTVRNPTKPTPWSRTKYALRKPTKPLDWSRTKYALRILVESVAVGVLLAGGAYGITQAIKLAFA